LHASVVSTRRNAHRRRRFIDRIVPKRREANVSFQ